MGLLDSIGNSFGGDTGNDELARMLGLDPAVLRKQAAMNAIGQFGAAMLAQAAPSTRPSNFASAFGNAYGAGRSAYADTTKQSTNQAYQLGELRRMKTQDDRTAKDESEDDAFRAMWDDPANLAKLPPSMQKYASVLGGLDRKQAVPLIIQSGREDVAQERADALAKKGQPQSYGYESTGLRMVFPDGHVEVLQQPQNAPQPGAGPGEIAKQFRDLSAIFGPDKARQMIGNARDKPALDPQTRSAQAKDASGIQNALPGIQNALRSLDQAEALIKSGKVKMGSLPFTGGLGNYQEVADAKPNMLNGETQRFNSLAKGQITAFAKSLPGSFSNKEGTIALLAGFNLANSPQANLDTIAALRQNLQTMHDEGTKRLHRYSTGQNIYELEEPTSDGNGAVDAPAGTGAAPPVAAPTAPPQAGAPGPAATARPPGLPATAKLGSDGRWYDPATRKVYQETP